VNSPFWIAQADKVAPRRAPEIGEHSNDVLRAAGYGDAEIGRLRASGAVA